MAEPFRDPLGYKTKKVTLVIISVVGVAVILAGVWVGVKFNQYRDSGGLGAISSAPAMVSISEPLDGIMAGWAVGRGAGRSYWRNASIWHAFFLAAC